MSLHSEKYKDVKGHEMKSTSCVMFVFVSSDRNNDSLASLQTCFVALILNVFCWELAEKAPWLTGKARNLVSAR